MRKHHIRAAEEATRQLGSEESHPATPVATIVSAESCSAVLIYGALSFDASSSLHPLVPFCATSLPSSPNDSFGLMDDSDVNVVPQSRIEIAGAFAETKLALSLV